MSDLLLLVSKEEGVKRDSLCNKRTGESSWCFGGVICGVWL